MKTGSSGRTRRKSKNGKLIILSAELRQRTFKWLFLIKNFFWIKFINILIERKQVCLRREKEIL